MHQFKISLCAYTRKYPEWAQHETIFRGDVVKSIPINTVELFTVLNDSDPLFIPKEYLEESKKTFSGLYD